MRRYVAFLLPAVLLLAGLCEAAAEWAQRWPAPVAAAQFNDIPGTYENISSGGYCSVEARRGGFLFTNERGSSAWFAYVAPGQLQMVSGEWDPNVVVTVGRDAYGRTLLRFDAPGTPTGYWVKM